MKKILALILLVVIAVVGFKFYLEHRYKQELDKLVQMASLFADVSYKDLTVGFDGAVEVQGVRVVRKDTFDTFSVKSIGLSGVNFLFHLNGKSQIEKGEFPKRLNVVFKQLSFPASVYEGAYAEQECKSLFGTALYSSAGYDEVVANARMDLDLSDPFAANVNMISRDQISNVDFSMGFNARQANPVAVASEGLPIETIRYSFSLEADAAQEMVQHCADKFSVTPDDFIEKVAKSKKFMTNSFGLDLGEKARGALSAFLRGGRELNVTATPSDRLKNLQFASQASPASILRMLNLSVTLDDQRIPIQTSQVEFSDSEAESDEGESLLSDKSEQGEGFKRRTLDELLNTPDGTVQERSKPKLAKKRKSEYQPGTLNRVKSYVGRDVRVSRTNDRSPIEGYLLGVEKDVLSVEILRYGGVMTYTVPYKDIARLEVKKR